VTPQIIALKAASPTLISNFFFYSDINFLTKYFRHYVYKTFYI